jgi:phosphoribosylformylglycinamidine (FGAM) synthase PurS component
LAKLGECPGEGGREESETEMMTTPYLITICPRQKKLSIEQKHWQRFAKKMHFRFKSKHPLYRLKGTCSMQELEYISRELLSDPVTETFYINATVSNEKIVFADVWYKPGVTDPAAESVLKAIQDLGITKVCEVATGVRYTFETSPPSPPTRSLGNGTWKHELLTFANQYLLNPLVQECVFTTKASNL